MINVSHERVNSYFCELIIRKDLEVFMVAIQWSFGILFGCKSKRILKFTLWIYIRKSGLVDVG